MKTQQRKVLQLSSMLRWLAMGVIFTLPLPDTRADVAVLREKGPFSGSAFSNPGLITTAGTEPKISMRTATVRIHLGRGPGDHLLAKCEADFEMENLKDAPSAADELLVAFPVSGLNSKIVTISGFSVTVDDVKPATILRQSIAVSRRESELRDTLISGQLDAHFQQNDRTLRLRSEVSNETIYQAAYLWVQKFKPSSFSHVSISYQVELIPQSLKYQKSYHENPADLEVIPFSSLNVEDWNDKYYFFDYVLLSGATWAGPIGNENIKLIIDPGLLSSSYRIRSFRRQLQQQLLPPDEPEDPEMPKERNARERLAAEAEDICRIDWLQENIAQWTIKGKPKYDILLAIPYSAVKHIVSESAK